MACFAIRWSTLPVLVLPAYVMTTSLQACSSSTDDETNSTASALTCSPSETAKTVGNHGLCCAQGSGGGWECRAGSAAPGGSCTSGATASGDAYTVNFDVCMKEACSGDRTCEEFATIVERRQGQLACQNGAWAFVGTPDVHRVERACLVSGYETCGDGSLYGNDYTSGYTISYFTGNAYACGYGADGYYGPASIVVHALYVLQSTCASSGAPAPCPVDDL